MRRLLFPFSWIYAFVVWLRNVLYDLHILKSRRAVLPTLVVGNIHLGGTGKTPHTRWFARNLEGYHPAILSRGYGRKSRGYQEVHEDLSPEITGDEPRIYLNDIPKLKVRVCEDRLEGISRLSAEGHKGIVILDDAMQHRRLQPDALIALIRADQVFSWQMYLPAGNLRDHKSRLSAADAIIITAWQSHHHLLLGERSLQQALGVATHVPVFLSKHTYGHLRPLNGTDQLPTEGSKIIAVSGLANSTAFEQELKRRFDLVHHFDQRDHYWYSGKDLEEWKLRMEKHAVVAIITTEKDAVKLASLPSSLPIFILPIDIELEQGEELLDLVKNKMQKRLSS